MSNSNITSIWDDDRTSLFDPSPFKTTFGIGSGRKKSNEELMQEYFELWRDNVKSDLNGADTEHQGVISKERFRRLYTIPFADEKGQQGKFGIKDQSPRFSLDQSQDVPGSAAWKQDSKSKQKDQTGTGIPVSLRQDHENSASPRFSATQKDGKPNLGRMAPNERDQSPRFVINQPKEQYKTGAESKQTPKQKQEDSAGSREGISSALSKSKGKVTEVGMDSSPRFSLNQNVQSSKAVEDGTPRVSFEAAMESPGRRNVVYKTSEVPGIDVSRAQTGASEDRPFSNEGRSNKSSLSSDEVKQTISPRISLGDGNSAFFRSVPESTRDAEADVLNQPEIRQPARTAPQLVNKSPYELVIKWDPWTATSKGKQSVQIEYSLEWKEGRGPSGQWNSVPLIFRICEARKRNLNPSSWYSFRIKARLVKHNFYSFS